MNKNYYGSPFSLFFEKDIENISLDELKRRVFGNTEKIHNGRNINDLSKDDIKTIIIRFCEGIGITFTYNIKLPELKFYTYGFECPDISKINTKEQKDNVYNKLLNQFQRQLKEWIYGD